MKRLILILGRVALSLVALAFVTWCGVVVAVVRAGGTDEAASAGMGSADAIVVLGAAQYDGRPSPVLKFRLDHAIALWKRQLAPRLIFTGGRGAGDTTSEAAVGRRYAERAGVADSAIFAETQGRSTRESVAGVVTIAREHGIRRVIVVSDAAHVLRVAVLARQGGLEPITSPARPGALRRDWRQVLSESVKVPVAWLARFAD
jgi:uncharacterized SAM-binding protein YcdF (DUF218 family)